MDNRRKFRHQFLNTVQTLVLLMINAALLGGLGWLFAGLPGLKLAMIAVIIVCIFTPKMPADLIMRHLKARPLLPGHAPKLYAILGELSRKAGLNKPPRLYYLPSESLNAFAVGSDDDAAIGITRGLALALPPREMAAILGHELTHIKNNDLQIMFLSAVFGRLTHYLSLAGQLLLIILFPMTLSGYIQLSLLPLVLMASAPVISLVLYLALSRTREFEADLGSAALLNDAGALAAALTKVERFNARDRRYLPRPVKPVHASVFQSHPPTRERVRRLMAMTPGAPGRGTRVNRQIWV